MRFFRAIRRRKEGRTQPAGGGPGQDEARIRAQERKQALRRATFLALWLMALALSARAVVGDRGLLAAHRSRYELTRLEADVDKWRERNAYLDRRIKALRDDPATIESIARERLGWIRPGEITFLFPHDPAAPEPGDPGPVAPGEFSPTSADELEDLDGAATTPEVKR